MQLAMFFLHGALILHYELDYMWQASKYLVIPVNLPIPLREAGHWKGKSEVLGFGESWRYNWAWFSTVNMTDNSTHHSSTMGMWFIFPQD